MKSNKLFIAIICIILTGNFLLAQNITNTLGSSGIFTIKSSSANFLTLSQSTGNVKFYWNIELGTTTFSTIGVLTKNGNRFLHNFAPPGITVGNNTFLGLNSGNFTMSGSGLESSDNTGVGSSSLFSLTTGRENIALGNNALYSNSSGDGNIALGFIALTSNTTGDYNVSIGSQSLTSNISGSLNIGIGVNSLRANTSGNTNVSIGAHTLAVNTTGSSNIAIGHNSLTSSTIGNYNISIGVNSLWRNTTGNSNTAIGYNSLYNSTTANENTAFSYQSLYNNSTGNSNTAIGYQSLYSSTTASENTALGYQSLYANTTGYDNTSVGKYSLNSNTFGFLNTALGFSTGSTVTTGSNLTMIGYNSEPTSPTAVNQVTLGDGSVSSLRCNVQTITSLSDKRDKKNISDLSLGLDFIAKLKPRQFNWDKREWYDDNTSDGSKMQEIPTAGFIAQELDETQTTENAEWLNLVLKDNPEKLEATYGNLLPVMVKAIQELNEENQILKNKNQTLDERLAGYEQTQSLLLKKLNELESKQDEIKEIKLTGVTQQ